MCSVTAWPLQTVGQQSMAAAGFADRDHYSVAAGVSHAGVDDVIKQISAVHGPVSLGDKARLRTSFQAARAIQGIADAPPSPHPPTPITVTNPTVTSQPPPPQQISFPSVIVWKKALDTDIIALNETVWQGPKVEAKLLPTGAGSEVKAGYARYRKLEGYCPSEEEDVAVEQ